MSIGAVQRAFRDNLILIITKFEACMEVLPLARRIFYGGRCRFRPPNPLPVS
jgi:hypothetical protein